jgi:hypothetical protein
MLLKELKVEKGKIKTTNQCLEELINKEFF